MSTLGTTLLIPKGRKYPSTVNKAMRASKKTLGVPFDIQADGTGVILGGEIWIAKDQVTGYGGSGYTLANGAVLTLTYTAA